VAGLVEVGSRHDSAIGCDAPLFVAPLLDGSRREHRRGFLRRSLRFALGANALQLSKLIDEHCLVLLGEPGLGKSHAIDDAVAEHRRSGDAMHLVNLGAYEDGESLIGAIIDDAAWRAWRESDDLLFLFLDGLDEALLHVKAIHKRLIVELKKLDDDLCRLRLRISCRSAEWLPDFESQLAEVFGSSPKLSQAPALAPLRFSRRG